jgi:hypothetical protein
MVKLRATAKLDTGHEAAVIVVGFVDSTEDNHTYAVCLRQDKRLIDVKLINLHDVEIIG